MLKQIIGIICVFALYIPNLIAKQEYPSHITVAQDGSGDYRTIQAAVNSVRDLGEKQVTIHIKKGIYHEKLIIPSWKTNISLIGEHPASTIITGNDYSGKPVIKGPDNLGLEKYSTFTSYTFLIQADGIILENLTIQNTAGRVGQAVALHVEGDRTEVRNCYILGNQDTLYTATAQSRQYYINCFIEGTTDFIFGEATCVFQNCTIKSLADSYITAASHRKQQAFGYVFFNCKLIADHSIHKVYLGRPWRPYAKTVFIHCNLGNHVIPEGWHPWPGDKMFPNKEKTAYYAEYQNTGKGSDVAHRVAWSKQLTKKEMQTYTLKHIFSGTDSWVPVLHQ